MNATAPEIARVLRLVLTQMLEQHQLLLHGTEAHKAALGRADREAIASAVRTQAEAIERIRAIDTERRNAFGQTSSVQDVAAALPEALRHDILDLAASLRALIQRVRAEQAVVADASKALLGHMEGLFRQVSARLSHAGTYGRRGHVEAGAAIVSGVDLTR